ncbi:DUF1329 domain-containing protein [Stenotrophobium rhamnosiphilum]|uniref:DUF1329 domain-containing protein n=1 Tax=Stenotrophobium rhamnosiphilum TaxID=2029166 RepID=A0A2T5MKN6_9GAMM|nr:DUF1329 domain-containing protein [Stenotrophobium rhamnosiphilum]PTU33130.1 DUF1329 domain-containing protein [Stenotrophobium rhamnosiphilum]
MSRSGLNFLAAFLCLTLAGQANAKVSTAEAAQIGQSLTEVGAEKAASADGRIPAWTGGIKPADFGTKFANFKQGNFYPELFSEDKPLLKITHDNYKKYVTELPAGAQLMLERYPQYFLNVYKSRRTAAYPDFIAKATQENATTAHLEGGDDLKDSKLGFPFPIPKTGMEAIWNHKVRYLGSTVDQTGNFLVVSPDGGIHSASYTQSVRFQYANPKMAQEDKRGMIFQLVRTQVAPPRLAGQVTMAWEYQDGSREAWLYTPGTHRVLKAPSLGFDAPMVGTDGGVSIDQGDMFNGSLKQYSWKLLGKRAMYIAYNNYHLQQPSLKYSALIRARHLAPEHLRYELHRVWVVEATLAPGQKNVIAKRVFYIDEDSWTIAAVDCYDSRNQLWRYQEGHLFPLIVNQIVVPAPMAVYDFTSGRYVLTNLVNELPYVAKFDVKFSADYFTPQRILSSGRQ